jgi:uncharacterized membrane protein (DUF373 family)
MESMMNNFEKIIVKVLMMMMMIVIALSTLEMGWIIAQDIYLPPKGLLNIEQLLDIFGFFLMILIGIELLETIKAYLVEKVIHMEVVLDVALIAIARKVIILDLNKYSGVTIIGIGLLILAIASAIYLLRICRNSYIKHMKNKEV